VLIKKVMLVDDEPDIRAIAKLCLEGLGRWQVVTAATAAEALTLAADQQPDVILLDVMMPDTTGPALFAAFRERPKTAGIPIIFVTACSAQAELDQLLSLGALGVIAKPFDPIALSKDVQRLFDTRQGT